MFLAGLLIGGFVTFVVIIILSCLVAASRADRSMEEEYEKSTEGLCQEDVVSTYIE